MRLLVKISINRLNNCTIYQNIEWVCPKYCYVNLKNNFFIYEMENVLAEYKFNRVLYKK